MGGVVASANQPAKKAALSLSLSLRQGKFSDGDMRISVVIIS
jgi:hypothetical protein